MSFQSILTSVEDNVGTLTLNRPDAMNAFNRQMMNEVEQIIDTWDSDESIRAIIVTGSEKAFAAGADIVEMKDLSFVEALQADFVNGWTCIADCRTPTIAAVAGYALGGGCEVAMMCDILICADNAQFGQPEIRIGTIPGLGGTQRLTHRIGAAKAMDMCLTGRMMKAEEAERSGLVSRVVPLSHLLEEAKRCASNIASYSAPSVLLAKRAVQAASNTTLEQGLAAERQSFYALFGTDDQKEGMNAFVEKRAARFSR